MAIIYQTANRIADATVSWQAACSADVASWTKTNPIVVAFWVFDDSAHGGNNYVTVPYYRLDGGSWTQITIATAVKAIDVTGLTDDDPVGTSSVCYTATTSVEDENAAFSVNCGAQTYAELQIGLDVSAVGDGVLIEFSQDNGTTLCAGAITTASGQTEQIVDTKFEITIEQWQIVDTEFEIAVEQWQIVDTQFEITVQTEQIVDTAFEVTVEAWQIVDTVFEISILSEVEQIVDTEFEITVEAWQIVDTSFEISVQIEQIVDTAFEITVQIEQIVDTSFEITIEAWQIVDTQFEISVQTQQIVDTQFEVTIEAWQIVDTKFEIEVQGIIEQIVDTVFEIAVEAWQIVDTVFEISVEQWQIVDTKFEITVEQWQIIDTEFEITVEAWQIVDTQFEIEVQSEVEQIVDTQFEIKIEGWQIVDTQFEISVQIEQIVDTAFEITVQIEQIVDTAFEITIQIEQIVDTAFEISVEVLVEQIVDTVFEVTIEAWQIVDVAFEIDVAGQTVGSLPIITIRDYQSPFDQLTSLPFGDIPAEGTSSTATFRVYNNFNDFANIWTAKDIKIGLSLFASTEIIAALRKELETFILDAGTVEIRCVKSSELESANPAVDWTSIAMTIDQTGQIFGYYYDDDFDTISGELPHNFNEYEIKLSDFPDINVDKTAYSIQLTISWDDYPDD